MHRILGGTAAVLGLAVALVAPAAAHVRLGTQGSTRPPIIHNVDTGTQVSANRISMFVTNIGSFAFDLGTGNSGLEFPKGTGNTAVFAAGLWMGAKVGAERRVTVAEYSQEFVPGPMSGGTFLPDTPEFKVYKVTREPTGSTAADSADWQAAWADWVTNAGPLGAPVEDVGNGPQPAILGDETLWSVFNDADPGAHSNDAGASAPLGVEVQLTSFAFNRTGALGNTVFLKYVIINKGSDTLDSTYASIWSDPDLGGASDDLVGVDVDKSLGYCYNATNNDNQYGSTPPAVGFDFFKGPVVGGDTLGLASFNKYINGTDPNSNGQSYNYMKGLDPDGNAVIDPTTGQPTTFFNSGDPVSRTGWLDSNPADRRLMLSTGPFTMAPGDTQEIVAAVIIGDGADRLSSVRALRFYDQFAQDAFDKNFDLPNPPPTPQVTAEGLNGAVVLTWDGGSQVNDSTSAYEFQGYNIWQGESRAGPWKRIKTVDIDDGTGIIQDQVFDANYGDIVTVPVQFGEDGGVTHSIELTQDEIRSVPLRNGTRYYYSVTAYSYDPAAVPGLLTLENAQGTTDYENDTDRDPNAISAIPQKPTAGSDYSVVSSGNVTQTRDDTNIPGTTDVVTVDIIDPSKVRDCTYEVYYTDLATPYPTYAGEEVRVAWNLRRICAGADTTVLLTDQLNKTGDADYAIFDGIQVKIIGAYAQKIQDVVYVKTDPDEPRDLQPADFGLAFYGGGADAVNNFRNSTIDPVANPDAFTSVEVRFSSTATQKAYRYYRDVVADCVGAPATTRGYHYGGQVDCNFQLWDTVADRQLDALVVEKRQVDAVTGVPTGVLCPTNDGTWAPSLEGDGDREYLFISNTTYSDAEKPEYVISDPAGEISGVAVLPLLYVFLSHGLDAANPYPDDGEKVVYTWANPGRPNDHFAFTPTPPVLDDLALAGSALEQIRVVPNPYYGRSNYERDQFNRLIRFMNLPASCTIRIFNLSGDLVRTLTKSDASTSVLNWDILTENQLPVGSGVYIYQVDAPGAGKTFGRMVVFTEKERLNNF